MMPIVDRPMLDISAGMFAGQSASSPEMLVLQAGAEGVTLSTVDNGEGDNVQHHVFPPGWTGLVVLDRIACKVQSGRGVACAVDLSALTKLQAFLDAARTSAAESAGVAGVANATDAVAHGANHAPLLVAAGFPATVDACNWPGIERWFLKQSVQALQPQQPQQPDIGDSDFAYIGAVLRSTEHYKLVRFLLTQPASRSLRDLSADYGLSYSHFRRLCREALGRGGKAEFQYWRNVRALLDMVDGGGSLTDVALRQGFSSSSHFSDAMKGQFGISPRYLTRTLDTEK
jgi:AraC-like DNA-binding protein